MISGSGMDIELFLDNVGLKTIGGYNYESPLVGGGSNITAVYCREQERAVAKFFFIGPSAISAKKFKNEVDYHRQGLSMTGVLPKIYTEFSSTDGFVKGYLMEYVAGTSLSDLIPSGGFTTVNETIAAFYRVTWAYHHTLSGLVHGDMHPGNIIFETSMADWLQRKPESPEVRILDLGASIFPFGFGYEETFDEDVWADVLKRYAGSFYSLPPEFFFSDFIRKIGFPGVFDCWALGLLLYKMHTGALLKIADSLGEYSELVHTRRLQRKLDQQIDVNCHDYHLNALLKYMLRVDSSERIKLHVATSYAGQFYNRNQELLSRRGRDLMHFVYHLGCDPEAMLPPHERSDSPY